MNTMLTYTVLINNTPSGILSAPSYREAVKRAKAKFRGPVDVIGMLSSRQRV